MTNITGDGWEHVNGEGDRMGRGLSVERRDVVYTRV